MELIIIGSGPAGLSAGLYGKRLGLDCLIIEGKNPSQATLTEELENIPGIPKISGFDFIDILKEQVKSIGVPITSSDCKKIIEKDGLFEVHTDDKIYTTKSIIIATGASCKRLNIEGEERLTGKGVSYCAVCDGPFFKDKNVVVVGGGDAAIEEALFLTKFANRVSVIHRRDELRAAKLLQKRAFSNERIEFILSSVLEEIIGENRVSSVKIRNLKTNEEKKIECDGVFIFVGLSPNNEIARGILLLSDNGYIVTDEEMHTSKRGIFAAGDVREKTLRQVITALADGANASYSSFLYLKEDV
ncbi:MAG: thioredoxin-disulfide reductase [bacterium]